MTKGSQMTFPKLSIVAPSDLLRSYVQFYIQMGPNAAKSHSFYVGRQHNLPTGQIFMGFVFNRAIQVKMHNESGFCANYPVFFSGQIDKLFWFELPEDFELFVAVLKPSTANRLTGMPLDRLRNKAFDAGYHICPQLLELQDRMIEINLEERVLSFEKWLLGKLRFTTNIAIFTDWVSAEIIKSKGVVCVTDLARMHKVSERHLQRTFKQRIGISPHKYATIVKMNNIANDFNHSHVHLIDLLSHYGYFDKSHFRRQFKHFTGTTFASYLELQNANNKAFLQRTTF